ncbi:MAG TPA: TonB-dependent receptor [Chitinophagales bacterium]|nr:TonB-dependent receptor [Chitinophagales bacterium]
MIRHFLAFVCLSCLAMQGMAKLQAEDSSVVISNGNGAVDTASILLKALQESIPVITLDDVDDAGGSPLSDQNISSALNAGRDPFFSASAFAFGISRFRIKGYNFDQFETYFNGIPTEFIDNGFSSYNVWAGLNDVTRNRENVIGIKPSTFGYGMLGGSYNIDARASKQRKQLQVSLSFSNRTYDNRLMITYGSGISKKGWSYAVSLSGRISKEGYIEGTQLRGISYFASIEKLFNNNKHSLSLTALGAPTQTAKASAAIQEVYDLAGTNYYNPNWGYQNGKKRNARVENRHQPLFVMMHEWKINDRSNLVTSAGYSFGERANSGIDWYNAADPRPDYYRYLPSYIENPAEKEVAINAIKEDPSLLQINWDRLYEVNRNNTETIKNVNGIEGNNVTGLRSLYIVRDEVEKINRFNTQSVYNVNVKNTYMTAGFTYQYLKRNVFNRVRDLLGGEFFVDINQFAERDFPEGNAAQNDINTPNRLLKVGDQYAHNVNILTHKTTLWGQVVQKFNKVDVFAAAELGYTRFWRDGKNQNGLFPENSLGKSDKLDFLTYSAKAGVTYKVNGRNYIYASGHAQTRAPYFDNIFVSYRTRDFYVKNPTAEKIYSAELGYILNHPIVKMRASMYFTKFNDASDIRTFFDERFNSFANISLTNIDKIHYGGEFAMEAKVYKGLSATLVAAVGNHYYSDRMNATTYVDNTQEIFNENEVVYSKGLKLSGAPQQAYTLGLYYRDPKFWYVSANVNFFDDMWADFNPIRRTQAAVDAIPYQSEQWFDILKQERLNPKGQWTLDVSGGYSWRLKSTFRNLKKSGYYLVFNVGINNLTNNKKFITNAYEQLRFDRDERNPSKFPTKYSYAYGITYFVNIAFRMN